MFQPFLERLPRSPHILCVPSAQGAAPVSLPFEVQAPDKSVLFWTPTKESFDGAWVHGVTEQFKKDECLRLLGTLFLALRPGAPLWITTIRGETGARDDKGRYTYLADDFESALKQSGFVPELRAVDPLQNELQAWIARRL